MNLSSTEMSNSVPHMLYIPPRSDLSKPVEDLAHAIASEKAWTKLACEARSTACHPLYESWTNILIYIQDCSAPVQIRFGWVVFDVRLGKHS